MEPRLRKMPKLASGAYQALAAMGQAIADGPVPKSTLELVKIRASQINGCGFCVDMHAHEAKAAGETDARLFSVAAWREAPYFTDAERAALALTEAATRLADRADAVPDDVWAEAAAHYDEEELATLVVAIANINAWNRINVTIRQPAVVGGRAQGSATSTKPKA